MVEEKSWTCARCFRKQRPHALMTYPGRVDAEGTILLLPDAPACCPQCAELLPSGADRVDVLMRFIGLVDRRH